MMMPGGAVPLHLAYALSLTGKREPRICVINTAIGDDPRWAVAMYDRFIGSPARLSHLSLFPMPNVTDPADLLLSQDAIFVGGGSVANMLAVWRVHGLDTILRKASIASMPGETWIRSPNTTMPSTMPATGSPAAIAGKEACSGA